MNHNSLIIAADASRARLFRIAQTNDEARPIELIDAGTVTMAGAAACLASVELGAPTASESVAPAPLREAGADEPVEHFARRIAERVASFGEHHVCNPIIVVASQALGSAIVNELESKLVRGYIRSVHADVARLTPGQLLERLQSHVAFIPTRYSSRAS